MVLGLGLACGLAVGSGAAERLKGVSLGFEILGFRGIVLGLGGKSGPVRVQVMLQGLGLRFGRREGSYQGLNGSSAVKVFSEFGPLLLLHSWGFGRREVAGGFDFGFMVLAGKLRTLKFCFPYVPRNPKLS